jgi:hypothetical protein
MPRQQDPTALIARPREHKGRRPSSETPSHAQARPCTNLSPFQVREAPSFPAVPYRSTAIDHQVLRPVESETSLGPRILPYFGLASKQISGDRLPDSQARTSPSSPTGEPMTSRKPT